MKKLLLVCTALMVLSAPALAFGLTSRLEASYRLDLGDGWDVGIQGRFDVDWLPQPTGFQTQLRPYIRYSADIVDSDELSLSVYLRARLPLKLELAPAPAVGSYSLNLQAGLDLSYSLSKRWTFLAGLEFDGEFIKGFDYTFNGFAEFDYELDVFTVYSGLSLDEILPPPLALTYYAGLSTDLNSQSSLSLEYAHSFANASRRADSSLTFRVSFSFK